MKRTADLAAAMTAIEYREFLNLSFEALRGINPSLSYSMVARDAGFSARSYVREIFVGLKPVSVKSFDGLCRGLRLPKAASAYLRLLLAQEFSSFNSKKQSHEEIRRDLVKQRAIWEKRHGKGKVKNTKAEIFLIHRWPVFFASLGTQESGASLQEVSDRTGYNAVTCTQVLSEMEKYEVVKRDRQRYYPTHQHLVFQSLYKEKSLQDTFVADLKTLNLRASQNFYRNDHLFFDSTFSVSKENIPALKKALWETLVEFIDEHEQATGDQIYTAIAGLIPVVE